MHRIKYINFKKAFSICLLIAIISISINIQKTYSIYKLQKDVDIIKSQIKDYKKGDVKIAVLVDGKEATEFPSYETNYKVESIDCTNGIVASWDIENWRLAIDDMKATSTSCTVNFDSTKTNSTKPINMSKSEILALNEDIKKTSARTLADYLYPVGSIYMSTEDDTIDKVEQKFGGTWVKYGEDMTLVGASSTKAVNSTGGSSTTTLSVQNIPNHTHTTTQNSTSSVSLTANSAGAHTHVLAVGNASFNWPGAGNNIFTSNYSYGKGNFYYTNTNGTTSSSAGSHSHSVTGSVTIPSLTTNSCTNCSATSFSVQNPYTAVYMYKRTA